MRAAGVVSPTAPVLMRRDLADTRGTERVGENTDECAAELETVNNPIPHGSLSGAEADRAPEELSYGTGGYGV